MAYSGGHNRRFYLNLLEKCVLLNDRRLAIIVPQLDRPQHQIWSRSKSGFFKASGLAGRLD